MPLTATLTRTSIWRTHEARVAALALFAIVVHLIAARVSGPGALVAVAPLGAALVIGAVPLLISLVRMALAGDFGADFLAGLSIVAASVAGEYLVAVVVVLMWAGGQSLERYASQRASSVLDALARRNPTTAHRRSGDAVVDVALADVEVADVLVVLPHEVCPVDGVVREGTSTMDEAFISGEPFQVRKTVGSAVISGAMNGETALTIVAERRAVDSRYARIVDIVRNAELHRPRIRRLADRLGGWYTPLAVGVAGVAWALSGQSDRFLAVLVIATPCPLLLGIPVSIIGAISLAAQRSILISDASILERIGACRTVVFDKTGTLTLGRPELTEVKLAPGADRDVVLQLAASIEQYSKHPLGPAILRAADAAGLERLPAASVSEKPGQGLTAHVNGRTVAITSRARVPAEQLARIAGDGDGLECVVLLDDEAVALFRFRDAPRRESAPFVGHLAPRHGFNRILLVSGDRESEVRYLASLMGITDVFFSQSPEQKVAIVNAERARQPTLFVGDGLNDAPAMVVADVAIALGQRAEVAAHSAGAVILDDSLSRVDELMHIARRTKRIALQSAVGGMVLSLGGMALAAAGWLPPIGGVIAQEAIDVCAVLNALRAAWLPRELTDYATSAPGPSVMPGPPGG